MDLQSEKSIGLLGYIITANDEIHSRQIKWLNIILEEYKLENYLKMIKEILDDKDDKISYNECLQSFQQELSDTKIYIYKFCYQLSVIDSDKLSNPQIDSYESKILKSIERYIDNVNFIAQRKFAIKEINKRFKQKSTGKINNFNLNFDEVINVASKDYEDYESTFNKIFSECALLNSRLSYQLKNKVNSSLMQSALNNFLNEYSQKVISTISELKENVSKKELALNGFSIALMGRTKAGKSTLHYIMCNEGEDFIGKGGQRTTRFNRVFSWNNLKIIDTPGIGAGEEDGRKDEEIAMRVLSQADMVCFVVVDDTIQNDILELLNKIAEYHKPMLIVLNHKDDIENRKSHLKTFLKNPNEWRLTKGESNLTGYINRLKRNAEKHNYDKLMKVVPVFLLAAKLGKEKNNEIMFQASNYNDFINSIQALVEENGLIYKSQTMLDEPSIRLHKAVEILQIEESKLIALQKKVKNVHSRINESIESSEKEILSGSKRAISSEFDDFYTARSYKYVEENYTEKSVINLKKSYDKHLEDYGVKNHIESILSDYVSEYYKKNSEILSQIDEELNYAKINTENLFNNGFAPIEGNKGTFPFKELLKLTSMVLDVVSIAFPVLAIISVPISIMSLFPKSKQKKINNAKSLTLENFKKQADYSEKQV